jgi:hypothetical protein
MATEYQLNINFLPFMDNLPAFCIYRKKRGDPSEPCPDPTSIRGYSLPVDPENPEGRLGYWISIEPREGFTPFMVKPSFNNQLSQWMLYQSLIARCQRLLRPDDFWIPERSFLREIHFNMCQHNEGVEQLVIQPYHLRVANSFGLVADFHFRLGEGIPFSRRVQQLSLSLDRGFKRNLDFYLDRFAKISEFLNARWAVLSPLNLPGAEAQLTLSRDFKGLRADRLHPRVFVFANGREARGQFTGLRQYGPIKGLPSVPNLLFIFREQDRQAARDLAAALRGSKSRERFSFPGFENLFKSSLEIDRTPIVVADFSRTAMTDALQRAMRERENHLTVPIVIMPDDDDEAYLNHKAVFTHAGVPSQACTLGVIRNENTLKWSVANIALQIFCKASGLPWKVRPTAERCLIVGISQSHKLRRNNNNTHSVERYFAFSVLTDNSGLFQKIQVLGEHESEDRYLEMLRQNLESILKSGSEEFSRVVVHTSFKLKHREMDEIQAAVRNAAKSQDCSECQFAVVKVNHRSRFFGANRSVNSLVPYEGSRVKLGRGEYLIWFEGIFPDKRIVTKAFPGPTHIQFLRAADEKVIADEILLQDLMNLSGANWRGFNAKSAPVSVFYCHLVADLVHDFQERGLPLPAVEVLQPWFL